MKRGTKVGLIVNASASRDVRRLTSLARTIDVHERVNTVARVLGGLAGGRVGTVLYMPEPARVVERALDQLAATDPEKARAGLDLRAVRLENGPEAVDAAGTARAASAMAEAGVECLVTIGGDGTNRAVVDGWPSAVVIPLPGGTNNAFATPIDPTAAGLAAALYAADPARYAGQVGQAPILRVQIDDGLATTTFALIDVVLVRGCWVGARALWDPALLVEAVVARSDPALTGMAGIGGMLDPFDGPPPRALHLRFGSAGSALTGPLGPGQLVEIGIEDWRVLGLDEPVSLGGSVRSVRSGGPAGSGGSVRSGEAAGLGDPASPGQLLATGEQLRPAQGQPLTLAFDGEREIVLQPGNRAHVHLAADGPRVLDAQGVLRAASRAGALRQAPALRREPALGQEPALRREPAERHAPALGQEPAAHRDDQGPRGGDAEAHPR